MNAFVFGDNTVEIKINGVSFTQDPAVVEVCIAAAQKTINEFNTKMSAGEADINSICETTNKIAEDIDNALCAGAVHAIFAGREKYTLHELTDIVIYVRAVMHEFEARRAELYKGYAKPLASGEE